MADPAKTLDTMVRNIEAKTGKTMAQLAEIVGASGLSRHGEIRTMLMERFGLGHGAANAVVHLALKSDGESAARERGLSGDEILAEMYAAKKAALRPIHDEVLKLLGRLGEHEAAPRKGYVSYRRRKQFATVGPKTNTAVEIGFGAKELPAHPRLKVMPPNSMCRYTTRLSSAAEVDAQMETWLRVAYEESG